jgi:hypothetical protein
MQVFFVDPQCVGVGPSMDGTVNCKMGVIWKGRI